jgi:hypothetical protein
VWSCCDSDQSLCPSAIYIQIHTYSYIVAAKETNKSKELVFRLLGARTVDFCAPPARVGSLLLQSEGLCAKIKIKKRRGTLGEAKYEITKIGPTMDSDFWRPWNCRNWRYHCAISNYTTWNIMKNINHDQRIHLHACRMHTGTHSHPHCIKNHVHVQITPAAATAGSLKFSGWCVA